MRIGVLGPLEVSDGGTPVAVAGSRLRALLIRLALDPGRYVATGALADGLWEGEPPADLGNALQSLVSRLRRALGRPEVVEYGGPAGYRLAVPPDTVDAVRFEHLASEGGRALRSGDPAAAGRLLDDALALWRGEALVDVARAPFAEGPAHRLEELRVEAVTDRLEAGLAAGRAAETVPGLEALTEAHPLRERPRVLLVRALDAAGRQPEALTAYEEFRARLAGELGMDPSAELRAAHLAVLRGEGGTSGRKESAAPAPDETPTNLRAPLTSFVGRDGELRRVRELLTGARLVTLTGPGGAGKTRLATTVATSLLAHPEARTEAGSVTDDLPGGVWLAELAPVTGADDVPLAVLGALGARQSAVVDLRHQAPQDVLTRVADTLAAAPAVLVLDNCEHVVAAAAHVAEQLLGRCPLLRVIATSREPLGIAGEALCPVPPLGLPPNAADAADAAPDSRDSHDDRGSSDPHDSPAVRLFADRARAASPGFAVTSANATAVAEICRRLDGLPLAIELAAARLRSLPLGAVAARLDDRFRLLTTGSRTALPRHRTLEAVVAWSWELLDEEERRLAERLSVFPGGATPAAVAGVCGMDETAALDLLAALADKSLLHIAAEDGPRYRMLETIREFGQERLARAGALDEARAAHAAYFVELAEAADPHLRAHGQLRWIALLDAEHDNLLAGLRWAVETRDAAVAVRTGASLGMYWSILGHHAEAAEWLRLVLEVPGPSSAELRAVALAFYMINSASSGRVEQLAAPGEELMGLAAQVAADGGHALLAALEPGVAMFTEDDDTGIALIEARLDHPDPWTRAMLRLMRAAFRENKGYAAGLREDLDAAADGFRSVGDRWGLAMSLTQLGEYQALTGEIEESRAALEEALRLMRELRARNDIGQLRVRLAELDARAGCTGAARAELTDLLRAALREGVPHVVVICRGALGDIARREGDIPAAARWYEEALSTWREGPGMVPQAVPQLSALLHTGMGHLECARGDLDAAARQLAAATEAVGRARDMPIAALVGVGLADLAAHRGETAYAAELLGAADVVRGVGGVAQPDAERLTARLRRALGDAFAPAHARGAARTQPEALALLHAAAGSGPAAKSGPAAGTRGGTPSGGPVPGPGAGQARRR
ncbi:BTAD domain-containing putative transcriptional regulator [Streptomyces sp. NPDC048172]|uniref:BTAD domain-containing putative transcriptional regulator n=1 Tax=Streptomyces sp. NPDC048172 TaxID=3365505 RepID=UPI0037102A56